MHKRLNFVCISLRFGFFTKERYLSARQQNKTSKSLAPARETNLAQPSFCDGQNSSRLKNAKHRARSIHLSKQSSIITLRDYCDTSKNRVLFHISHKFYILSQIHYLQLCISPNHYDGSIFQINYHYRISSSM